MVSSCPTHSSSPAVRSTANDKCVSRPCLTVEREALIAQCCIMTDVSQSLLSSAAQRLWNNTEPQGASQPGPAACAGPPGTNYAVMKKAFQEGWGGVIAKTVSLDSSKVVNVTPRYAKMRGSNGKDVRSPA